MSQSMVNMTETNGHCLEDVRLSSFDDDWPHRNGSLSGENMAKAGFHYLKKEDFVACFCCFVKIGGWAKDEDPKARHLELSPNCLFAQLAKDEGDLTIAQFCDVMCARSIAMLDHKFKLVAKRQERIVAQQQSAAIANTNGETINNQEARSIV